MRYYFRYRLIEFFGRRKVFREFFKPVGRVSLFVLFQKFVQQRGYYNAVEPALFRVRLPGRLHEQLFERVYLFYAERYVARLFRA